MVCTSRYSTHMLTNDSHLDGTVLHSSGMVLDALTRPSLMITDALNAAVVHPPRKERYAALFGMDQCIMMSSYR